MTILQVRRDIESTWITNDPVIYDGELGVTYSDVPSVSSSGRHFTKLRIGNGALPFVDFVHLPMFSNNTRTIFNVFNKGTLVANKYIGSYIPKSNLALPINCDLSVASCITAPAAAQTFDIVYMARGTSVLTTIGTVNFAASATVGTFTLATAQALNYGDTLFVALPSTADSTMANVSINIVLFTQAFVFNTDPNSYFRFVVGLVTTTDGTVGMFASGVSNLRISYSYVFSSGTVANSILNGYVSTVGYGEAVGTGSFGIVVQGSSVSTLFYVDYNTNVVSYGSSMSPILELLSLGDSGAATGNTTLGLFAVGNSSATNLITYSTLSVTLGTVFATSFIGGAGIGTSTFGLFALGNSTTTTNIYTYSGATITVGTVLTVAIGSASMAGSGNATLGIIAIGGGTTTTNSYTYSGSVVAVGTVLINTLNYGQAAGNSVEGLFSLSGNTYGGTNLYNYGTSVVTAGTNLAGSCGDGYGFSNGVSGINI